MNEEELDKQAAKAFNSQKANQAEIKRLEIEYTKLLCPKGKKECEPAYCSLRISNECPFIIKWRSISKVHHF